VRPGRKPTFGDILPFLTPLGGETHARVVPGGHAALAHGGEVIDDSLSLRHLHLLELALPSADLEYERFMIFSSERLQQVWRLCCGVRGGKRLTCTRFGRFLRECNLIDEHLRQADADLLFQQVLLRNGHALEDSPGMGFQEFCDALVEIAQRRYGQVGLDAAMQQLIDELPTGGPAEPPAAAPVDDRPRRRRNSDGTSVENAKWVA